LQDAKDQGRKGGGAGFPLLRLEGVSKVYGKVTAVEPLDLDINAGDFFAILGPSGCGKTTLLRAIGGFIAPTTGRIIIAGRDVTHLGPDKRPTNMVFQGYGLFPHMTVRQNIGYGLSIAGVPRAEIDARIGEVMALVRLTALGDRGVGQLSGGQQQRVALARALVMRPPVLLLDEPLAALDLKLRQAMQDELRRIHEQIGGTFVFVTHDQGEAMSLANRIAVMESGRLVQVGSPEDIYRNPRSLFVATFVGEANVFPGTRRGGVVDLPIGTRFDDSGPDGPVTVVVRPESLSFNAAAGEGMLSASGTIVDSVFLGSMVRYRVDLGGGSMIFVQGSSEDIPADIAVGKKVSVGWRREQQSVLSA
jgi:ABC-type Fe3+/spermidine/putrescine transport system ATPase subunit